MLTVLVHFFALNRPIQVGVCSASIMDQYFTSKWGSGSGNFSGRTPVKRHVIDVSQGDATE